MDKDFSSIDQLRGRGTSSLSLPSLITTRTHSYISDTVGTTTGSFNTQCNEFITRLNYTKALRQSKVNEAIKLDPSYTGHRQRGVSLAWEYEKADITMGGRGSENWNMYERNDIMTRRSGSVRKAEGHHEKNVADHPELQADPNNIKFYRSRKEHLEKGHGGNFQNESNKPLIDKDKMLRLTNRKRVIHNELKGVGLAALIGCATGASIGFILSLVQNGFSPDSLLQALVDGGTAGFEGAVLSTVSYGLTRIFGGITTSALTGVLAKAGVNVTENLIKTCNIGVTGGIIIIATSIYSYIKNHSAGATNKEAIYSVGKELCISVTSLAITMIVQSTYGGPIACAVGLGISAFMLGYSMYQVYINKQLTEKIQTYITDKSYNLAYGI